MMRDPEQTIGNLIDRQNTSFVGSVDEDGYPEIKAMLPPRKREGDVYKRQGLAQGRGVRQGDG